MMRTDKGTGKTYITNNIPVGKHGRINAVQNNNGYFTIWNENKGHDEDSWYNGNFIGDRYAVFKWINTTTSEGFFQQISPWYYRYGNAVRKMINISKEGN